ncbi:MAG: EamA family transporter [Pseudomonadales bacterium]|nr:DMT family transporter [Pseudomonadales bacterium]NIX09053.1 EamA family transporter [Pseudomonadales bacterium]
MKHDPDRQALAAALAAVLLWSTVATGFKLGLAVMAPLQLLLAGTIISAVFFAAVATARRRWVMTGRNLLEAAAFGIVNPALYYLVLFEAYDRLPAQLAQPLNYTWAITLAVLAVPVLKQRLTQRTLAGILVSYLGVLVLLSQGRFDQLPAVDWVGVALALGSTVLWAGYWLMNARSRTDPVGLMALSFLIATPLVAIACALGPGLPRLDWSVLWFGAWVGLVEMGVTFLLWQRAMRLTSHAARIGQLIFLSPFISLILISTVLGETIHWTSVLGLGVIVGGVLVTRSSASERAR